MEIKQPRQVWLVTGCSSGLGRSFVKAILHQGDFAVATTRNRETLLDLEQQYPGQVLALELDVTDRQKIHQVVQEVIERTGRVDGLVNNAG